MGTVELLLIQVHTKPGSPVATTRREINYLKKVLDLLQYPNWCCSRNAIIVGDFNQVSTYVGRNWYSSLDTDEHIHELYYTGSSSSKVSGDHTTREHRLDRYVKWLYS